MKFNLHEILMNVLDFIKALVICTIYVLAVIYLNGLFN